MIFPKLKLESVLQVEDKTRLDAGLSFVTNDETIIDVLIKPSVLDGFISVFEVDYPEKWYLDWAYETDDIVNPEIKVVTLLGEKVRAYDINVLSEVTDALFSTDAMLFPYEPQLYDYLPRGKSSYIYAHRAAQDKVLTFLDEQRIWKDSGERFTKFDIVDKEEFKRWSIFQTLLIIFESVQVSSGDIFQEKRLEYESEMKEARSRAGLRLDTDGDGVNETPYDMVTTRMIRR